MPLLALLATAAALLDLGMTRVFLRLAEHAVAEDTLRTLAAVGPLPRNLFAIAGTIALMHGIAPLMGAESPTGTARSVGVAGFAGFFLLMVGLATVFPVAHAERVSVPVSLFASMLAAQMLVWVLLTSAVLRPGPRGIRTALGLLVLASMIGLTLMVAELLPGVLRSAGMITYVSLATIAHEVLFLAVLLLVGVTLLRGVARERAWLALLPALLAGAATVAFFVVGMHQPTEFKKVLYGAFGWRALLDREPMLYVIPAVAGAAVGALGLFRHDGAEKQAGAAVVLLSAGGLVASSPARLLMWVLGAALLSRAAIVFGERIVAGRTAAASPTP